MARTSIGVGIVGYGRAGRLFHAQLIAREPRLKLCAVATRNLDRQKQARLDYPGIRVYSTVDELLGDDDVRLVVIATPHDTHAQMAIRAANEGRHVVVDKVMCLSVSEADQMISAAKAAGVLLSVFHNRRWDGDFLTIRRALAAGLLGRLRLAEIGIWGSSPSRGWRAQRQHMGGLLFDWGAH
ncbi:MAG: Gfo/Idh/MocA family protein, partial [Armatimonadota bacterium]